MTAEEVIKRRIKTIDEEIDRLQRKRPTSEPIQKMIRKLYYDAQLFEGLLRDIHILAECDCGAVKTNTTHSAWCSSTITNK